MILLVTALTKETYFTRNDNYFRLQSPSSWEVLSIVPVNMVHPFLYVFDIVKDMVQIALFATAIGHLEHLFKYWSSFSSVVSTTVQSQFSDTLFCDKS